MLAHSTKKITVSMKFLGSTTRATNGLTRNGGFRPLMRGFLTSKSSQVAVVQGLLSAKGQWRQAQAGSRSLHPTLPAGLGSHTNNLLRLGSSVRGFHHTPLIRDISNASEIAGDAIKGTIEAAAPAANASTSVGITTTATASTPSPSPLSEVVSSSPDLASMAAVSTADQLASTSMQIGDLKAMGLGSNTPVGLVEQLLEFVHVYTGIPWWGTIAATTVALRFLMFPLMVKLQRGVAKLQNLQPQLQPLQAKMQRAQMDGDRIAMATYAQEMRLLFKRSGVNPLVTLGMPFLQAPVMLCFFLALRSMSALPVPHMQSGGLWWFQDLTVADPYYILPAVAALSMAGTLEMTTRAQSAIQPNPNTKWIMRGLGLVVAVATCNFQTSIFVYWITNNILSALQTMIFNSSKGRQVFKIPTITKVKMAKAPDTMLSQFFGKKK